MNKRELIFYTVLDLIKTGKRFDHLTVSKIAEEAGIGKGTVYEYFSCKDEIILETVKYMINEVFEKLTASMSQEEFCLGITSFIDELITLIKESESNLGMLNLGYMRSFIPDNIKVKIKQYLSIKKGEFFLVINELFEQAKQQGKISDNSDVFTLLSAISLIISMTTNFVLDDEFAKLYTIEDFKKRIYVTTMKLFQ